jgi:hypothetical protein
LVGADPHADRIARDALGGSGRALIKADLGATQDRIGECLSATGLLLGVQSYA